MTVEHGIESTRRVQYRVAVQKIKAPLSAHDQNLVQGLADLALLAHGESDTEERKRISESTIALWDKLIERSKVDQKLREASNKLGDIELILFEKENQKSELLRQLQR